MLAAQQTPDFTTLASFVSSMEKEITEVFCDVLPVCWQAGLIGGDMFATDGCKLSSAEPEIGALDERNR